MVMYAMSDLQFQAVYIVLSFSLASMAATTVFLWFRSFAVKDKYKSAVLISGLLTFIAAYHYMRIFEQLPESSGPGHLGYEVGAPTLTGVPFNDAYRYMDWLLTVPVLLIEILLVMKLDGPMFSAKANELVVSSALMIATGYYFVLAGDLTPRWACWMVSMVFFLYIVHGLLVGLAGATESEADPTVQGSIRLAQVMTVASWCTYPVVYLFPMLGMGGASTVVAIQIGYCISDIISKCGVGLVIYQISYAKSSKEALLPA